MKRRGNRLNAQPEDRLVIGFNGFLWNVADLSVREKGVKVGQRVLQDRLGVDKGLDPVGGFYRNLAAVRPVNFIAVEFGGIVRSGDHDAGAGLMEANGERQHRRRFKFRVKPDPDAHISQHRGRQAGKIPGMDTAVEADGAGRTGKSFLEIGTQAPRCLCDRKQVHPVRPGAEYAAQPAGTEGKVAVEAVMQRIRVHLPQFS